MTPERIRHIAFSRTSPELRRILRDRTVPKDLRKKVYGELLWRRKNSFQHESTKVPK